METRRQTFKGEVSRVLAPRMLEVTLFLGLGVRLTRRVTLESAPVPNPAHYDAAMRSLITICSGGRPCFVDVTDADSHAEVLLASVRVPAKSAPENNRYEQDGKTWVDVSQLLRDLEPKQFAIDRTRAVIHGA